VYKGYTLKALPVKAFPENMNVLSAYFINFDERV
jgi:hypothetical protein